MLKKKEKEKKERVSIYLRYSLNMQEESTLGLSFRVAQRHENQTAPMACLPMIFARDCFRAFSS